MAKFSRTVRNVLSLALLLGLAAGAAWLIAQSRPRPPEIVQQPAAPLQQSPLATPTASRQEPTKSPPHPTATPTEAARPIPLCTFPGGLAPEVIGLSLDDYTFSAPKVVLTNTSGIDIAGWLPDGGQLLITSRDPEVFGEEIEVFNVRSGDLKVFGERVSISGKPVWLPAAKAVAYLAVAAQQLELRVSYGDPKQTELVGQDVDLLSLATAPDGQRLIYFTAPTGGQPLLWDSTSRTTEAMPFDLNRWKSFERPANERDFRSVWAPDGSQIAFYTYPALFLVNVGTGQGCEVDLGIESVEQGPIWIFEAKWSPDGHYLAMITTATSVRGQLLSFTKLAILDVFTGEQLRPKLAMSHVWDIIWAPDSQHIIALGQIGTIQGYPIQKAFLVSVLSGNSQPVLPEHILGGGSSDPGMQLAWSPDGRTIAVKCPLLQPETLDMVEDRLCLITVTPILAGDKP